MLFKAIFIALLGLTLTGCAVHTGSGYGHRGYERHYSTTYYQVPQRTVYVVPRHYRYESYRYEPKRYEAHRHDNERHAPRRYVPAPVPKQHSSNLHKHPLVQRQAVRDERREHRQEQPRQHHPEDRQQRPQDAQRYGSWSRDDERDDRERRRH